MVLSKAMAPPANEKLRRNLRNPSIFDDPRRDNGTTRLPLPRVTCFGACRQAGSPWSQRVVFNPLERAVDASV